jgi:hypothetical protein
MHSSWKYRGKGPWGFDQILLSGVLGVVRKSRGVPFFLCLIAFLCDNFLDITPAPRPLCASMFLVPDAQENLLLWSVDFEFLATSYQFQFSTIGILIYHVSGHFRFWLNIIKNCSYWQKCPFIFQHWAFFHIRMYLTEIINSCLARLYPSVHISAQVRIKTVRIMTVGTMTV